MVTRRNIWGGGGGGGGGGEPTKRKEKEEKKVLDLFVCRGSRILTQVLTFTIAFTEHQ